MLACWAAAAALFAAGGAAAQTCTSPVDIPDANLKAKLWSQLGRTGTPGDVTCADMRSLTRLNAFAARTENGRPTPRSGLPREERIESLEGLQYATNLTELHLYFNYISDISPLSGLSNLRILYINNNRILDLTPLRGLTSLEELGLGWNWISDLTPLQGLTSLRQLFIEGNRIQDLRPLRGMTGLQALRASRNRISDVSPLQGLTALAELNLEANRIQDIAALAANTGLGNHGDKIYLRENPLDAAAAGHIATIRTRGVGDNCRFGVAGCVLWDSVLDRVQGLKVVPQGEKLRASWMLLSDFAPTEHILVWREGDDPLGNLLPDAQRFSSLPQNGRVASVAAVTSHDVTGLDPGLYSFRLRPVRNGTRGEWSEEVTAYLLPKVKGVRVDAGGGSLAVTWTAAGRNSGVDGYRVEWKSGGEDYAASRRARVSGTRHTITGLAAGVEYTLRVLAVSGDEGWGPPSDPATGRPGEGDLRPAEVRLSSSSGSAASLGVRWGAWCGATTWLVQWKAKGEDYGDSRQAEVSGATGYIIGDLTVGIEYTVRVTPRDGEDCVPPFAESDEGAAPAPRPAPAAGFAAAGAAAEPVRVTEGKHDRAQLPVRLTAPSNAETVILWRTEDISAGASPAPARAGEDYVAVAEGRLTIPPGQTEASLTVRILDDNRRIEPLEAFRVRLLTEGGVRIVGEATAIVEIVDDDTAPQRRLALQKVLAGAGGRIAAQALAAIEERPEAGGEARAAIGGQALISPPAAGQRAAREFSSRAMSAEELLTGSSFDLPLAWGGREAGWRIWGQADAIGFDARPAPDFRMDGKMLSGFVGVERRVGAAALAGLALSRSAGDIDYTADQATTGAADVALTSLLPYAHWNPRPELGVWGALGIGWGDLEVEDEAGAVDTGLRMRMAAAGLRRDLAQWRGIGLAVKADAFLASLEADAARDLPGSRGDSSRLRLRMEGTKAWRFSEAERAELGLDFGGRRDGGDAASGLGLELGARLDYADASAGLALGMDARYLLAHRDKLKEWGAGLTARLDPGAAGLGPWLALAPRWQERQPGLDLDAGYGLAAYGGSGLLTPYAGLSLADRERRWKLGARAGLGSRASLSLEGSVAGEGPQLALSAGLRW